MSGAEGGDGGGEGSSEGASGRNGRNAPGGPKRSYVKNEAERAEDRADWRWLNARERGELPSHPLDARRIETYRRMEEAIGELPERFAPEGWSDAVLAEAERMDSARARALAPFAADPFDASEVSTESDRIRLAATRTKTWLASGTDSGLAVVDGDATDEAAGPLGIGGMHDPDWQLPALMVPDAGEPRRLHWLPVAAVGVAMAAVVMAWLVLRGQPVRKSDTPAQLLAINSMGGSVGEPKVQIVRGSSRAGEAAVAAVGDTYIATLDVPHGTVGELRLYRDDREVVARCPGTPGCTSQSNAELVHVTSGTEEPEVVPMPAASEARTPLQRLLVHFPLLAPGSYRLVYFEGVDLGEPSGELDRDLARCNCNVKMVAPVSVN